SGTALPLHERRLADDRPARLPALTDCIAATRGSHALGSKARLPVRRDMKTLTRLAIAGGAVFAAMALAAPALAAYVPKIDTTVPHSLGATGHTIIHVSVPPAHDSTARVVVYAPLGFTVSPGAPGTTIGSVDAKVRAIDLAGAIVPVTGTIEVRAPTGTALV